MANWYGTARTNYVTVMDGKLDELKQSVEPFSIDVVESNDGSVCFLSSTFDGSWPTTIIDDDGSEHEFDMQDNILQYLTDDSVLILMEVGAEKQRYLTGVAIAYKKGHRKIKISLDDIYKKAENSFNKDNSTTITTCTY